MVKLVLRAKEYEVKPGMTLLSALQKIDILPESVIATREGEMILEDEILKDGDVVKLIAVISGGLCPCGPFALSGASAGRAQTKRARGNLPAPKGDCLGLSPSQ